MDTSIPSLAFHAAALHVMHAYVHDTILQKNAPHRPALPEMQHAAQKEAHHISPHSVREKKESKIGTAYTYPYLAKPPG